MLGIELSDCGGNKMDAKNITLKEILEGESAK